MKKQCHVSNLHIIFYLYNASSSDHKHYQLNVIFFYWSQTHIKMNIQHLHTVTYYTTDRNLINLSWIFVKIDSNESYVRTVTCVMLTFHVSEIFFSKEPEKILPRAAVKRRDFSINSKAELWGNDNDSGERRGVRGTRLKITTHLWLLLDVLRHNPRHPGVRLFI